MPLGGLAVGHVRYGNGENAFVRVAGTVVATSPGFYADFVLIDGVTHPANTKALYCHFMITISIPGGEPTPSHMAATRRGTMRT